MFKQFFGNRIPRLFAMLFGLLTLIGLLFIPQVGQAVLGWASFLVAVALLLGVLNLMSVHIRRRNLHSLALIVSMLLVFGAAVLDTGLWGSGQSHFVSQLFDTIILPSEAALASLLAFFLLFATYRILQRKRDVWGVLFLLSIIIGLLLITPLPTGWDSAFSNVREYIALGLNLIVSSGMRGILIGVALGTIVMSLRILTGSERPYSK